MKDKSLRKKATKAVSPLAATKRPARSKKKKPLDFSIVDKAIKELPGAIKEIRALPSSARTRSKSEERKADDLMDAYSAFAKQVYDEAVVMFPVDTKERRRVGEIYSRVGRLFDSYVSGVGWANRIRIIHEIPVDELRRDMPRIGAMWRELEGLLNAQRELIAVS